MASVSCLVAHWHSKIVAQWDGRITSLKTLQFKRISDLSDPGVHHTLSGQHRKFGVTCFLKKTTLVCRLYFAATSGVRGV